MQINEHIKLEFDLVHTVDLDEILTLCFMECGCRLMN